MIAVLAAACLSTNTITATDAQWWRWRRPKTSLVTHTFTAATGSPTDVQAAITNAGAGDTVVIPAGTWDWTNCTTQCVSVTKAITLKGAGCTLSGLHRATACSTIIRDAPSANQDYRLIKVTLVANQTTRLSSIEFRNNGRSAGGGVNGAISLNAAALAIGGERFIVDHLYFNDVQQQAFNTYGVYGVMYHNTFEFTGSNRPLTVDGRPSPQVDWGDTPWALDTEFGSDKFLFFEDNTASYLTPSFERAAIDAFGGGRWVARENDVLNANFGNHGTESTGRARGGRAIENYRNRQTANFAGAQTASQVRSGPAMVWGNTLTGYGAANLQLNCDRSVFTPSEWSVNIPSINKLVGDPWGFTDGRSQWDVNDVGVPNATGTVQSYNSGTRTITVSGTPYTSGQYDGYVLRRIPGAVQPVTVTSVTIGNPTQINTSTAHGFTTGQTAYLAGLTITSSPAFATGQYVVTVVDSDTFSIAVDSSAASDQAGFASNAHAAAIASTTSNTLVLSNPFSGTLTFLAGDTFEINFVTHGLDCPGRASTASSFNFGGATQPNSFPSGNDQVTEPVYDWSNRTDGNLLTLAGQVGTNYTIRPNVHVYMETLSFTGATGTGTGTLAARPATCTTGVGYFATDQGSWNSSGSDGLFYKCTSTNTWTLAYTPYAYPHPNRNDNVVSQ